MRLGLALALLLLEVLVATRFRGHRFIRGSMGDILATSFLYFSAQACWPTRPYPRIVFVYTFACLVELGQFFQLATLFHFRPGSLPAILLGSTYSLSDIGMYALGCLVAAMLDGLAGQPSRKHVGRPIPSTLPVESS